MIRIASLLLVLAMTCVSPVYAKSKAKKATAAKTEQPAQVKHPKYVFYFIGDGMGMGHVNAAETYNRDVLGNSEPLLMLRFPVAAQVRTYSANKPITDSAAAGTALANGNKTNNGMIAVSPDSTKIYRSIAYDFFDAKYRVGIATSVAGDDATPAAFYANAYSRHDNLLIAAQVVKSYFNFFAGAVWRGSRDKDGNPNGWRKLLDNAGLNVYTDPDEIINLKERPRVALLMAEHPYGDQIGYTIDSIAGALTLPQITAAGLAQLYDPERGFFFMVEGGNIDWAAHANDGGAVIKEILNFQKAIDVAYQFYLAHPDETLIVITADHDTGGMALGRYDNSNPNLRLADFQRISKDRFSDYCKELLANGKPISWEEMKQFLSENLGFWDAVTLTEDEEEDLKEDFDRTFIARQGKDIKTLYNDFNQFAVRVFDILNSRMGIGWTATYHTGNFVPLYAIGAGSELFCRNLDNTQVPALIIQAAGLKQSLYWPTIDANGIEKLLPQK